MKPETKEKIIKEIKERIKTYKLYDGQRNRLVRLKDVRKIINAQTEETPAGYEWLNDNEIAKRNVAKFESEWEPEYGVARLEDYELWLEEEER